MTAKIQTPIATNPIIRFMLATVEKYPASAPGTFRSVVIPQNFFRDFCNAVRPSREVWPTEANFRSYQISDRPAEFTLEATESVANALILDWNRAATQGGIVADPATYADRVTHSAATAAHPVNAISHNEWKAIYDHLTETRVNAFGRLNLQFSLRQFLSGPEWAGLARLTAVDGASGESSLYLADN